MGTLVLCLQISSVNLKLFWKNFKYRLKNLIGSDIYRGSGKTKLFWAVSRVECEDLAFKNWVHYFATKEGKTSRWQLLSTAWGQTHCRRKKREVERNQALGGMHEWWAEPCLKLTLFLTSLILSQCINPFIVWVGILENWSIMINYTLFRRIPHLLWSSTDPQILNSHSLGLGWNLMANKAWAVRYLGLLSHGFQGQRVRCKGWGLKGPLGYWGFRRWSSVPTQ